MNEDYQKIYDRLPLLMESFVEIDQSTSTVKEAMQAITKTLQETANLYYVILIIIKNGCSIRDTAFGTNKEHVENYLHQVSHSPPSDISNSDFLVNIQKGIPLVWSWEKDTFPYFNGSPFPLEASGILLPIKRKGEVIGVVELGSKKIIPPENYTEDSTISHTFRIPLETIISKVNQIVESKYESTQ